MLARLKRVTRSARVVLVWSSSRNRWVKSDLSVLRASCPLCGSRKGVPCRGPLGYKSSTHYVRRDLAKEISKGP